MVTPFSSYVGVSVNRKKGGGVMEGQDVVQRQDVVERQEVHAPGHKDVQLINIHY